MSNHTHNNNNVLPRNSVDEYRQWVAAQQQNSRITQLIREADLKGSNVWLEALKKQNTSPSVKHIKRNMAVRQIRSLLLQIAQKPSDISADLCTHPLFHLLWGGTNQHLTLVNLAHKEAYNYDEHPQLPTLALKIKQALPVLSASFENELVLDEIWLQAARDLLRHPLPGFPLDKYQSETAFLAADKKHQLRSPKRLSFLPTAYKNLRCLLQPSVQMLSWCVVLLLSSYLFLIST